MVADSVAGIVSLILEAGVRDGYRLECGHRHDKRAAFGMVSRFNLELFP